MSASRPLRRLIIFGFYVNEVDGRFYWKHAHDVYVRGLLDRFDEVFLCPQVHGGAAVEEEIHTAKQTVEVAKGVTVRPVPSFRAPRRFIEANRWLRAMANDLDTAWLLVLPNSMAPLVVAFHRPSFAISYFGSDWAYGYLTQFGHGLRTSLKAAYYYWAQRRCAESSAALIVAGKKQALQWRGRGIPVHETRPIVALEARHCEQRRPRNDGPREILYVGHIGTRKGLQTLVAALPEIRRLVPGTRLRIVGQGPFLETLKQRLASDEAVVFQGYVPDFETLREVYRTADVLVIPSLDEGLPRVMYEAWAHSLPVVATAVGGIPYLVKDGGEALLVPRDTPGALGRAVARVLVDKDLGASLAERGLALVREVLEVGAGQQHAAILHEAWYAREQGPRVQERVVGPTVRPN